MRAAKSHERRKGPRTIGCIATQGSGHREDERILSLLGGLGPEAWHFDRAQKLRSLLATVRRGLRERPDALALEGTGIAGGAAVMLLRQFGIPYVVSIGDAVAPFIGLQHRSLVPVFGIYERLLMRQASGVICWSPYLAGRALTLGARRTVTAANWSPSKDIDRTARQRVRRALGIPPEAIVFGIAGSLLWTARYEYCYGRELVDAILRTDRDDVCVLIVGDGDGRERLAEIAGDRAGSQVFFTGRVPREEVSAHLCAMDVGSLPQSVDRVGAFRYTTKLSEYLGARLPVVTGQVPFAYDLDDGWLWRLPGDAPWEDRYIVALANLMASVTVQDITVRRDALPAEFREFDEVRQQRVTSEFVAESLGWA